MMLMMVAIDALYQLTHPQAIQPYEEIKRIIRPDGTFDRNQLISCEYLDCSLSET